MSRRNKNLEKGIESIDLQIQKHKEKIKEFGEDKPWLADYWNKEIEGFEKEKMKKRSKIK